MSKKHSSVVKDISDSPEEIREVVAQGARKAEDAAVRSPSSTVPRIVPVSIVLVSVVLVGVVLGGFALRRRT